MRCPKCGKESTPSARFCAMCGAKLGPSRGEAELPAADLGSIQASLSSQIEALTGSLDRQLADLRSSLEPAREEPLRIRPELRYGDEWVRLLSGQDDGIRVAWLSVKENSFVAKNKRYSERIRSITFHFLDRVAKVNAFATDHPEKYTTDQPDEDKDEIQEVRGLRPPAVVSYRGLATAVRLAAAALAAHSYCKYDRLLLPEGWALARAFQEMGMAIIRSENPFDLRTAAAIFEKFVVPMLPLELERQTLALARAYTLAMDTFVLAHEAGHIALEHTLGIRLNYDVSRNQEREADSFAASVLSTTEVFPSTIELRGQWFLGQVFVMVIFTWMEDACRLKEPGTHPLARERFASALVSNSEATRRAEIDLGLTRERLEELLPPEDILQRMRLI